MKLEHLAKQFGVRTSLWAALCTLIGGAVTSAVRAAPCGPVGIAVSGPNAVLTWAGSCALQESALATGPWTNVAGAASPYITAATTGAKFYRTLDPNGVCSPNVVAY